MDLFNEKWFIRNQAVKGSFDIVREEDKTWISTVHALGNISDEESLKIAKLIVASPIMLQTLIFTYLELQKLSNKSISNAIETDFIRANLRNKICKTLELDCETFQNYIETKAIE